MIEELARLETKSPDHSEPAPAPAPSQDAAPLNALLMSALAPGDVNFDEATAAAGPVRYTSFQRRRPKGDEVFRILPQTYGSTMVYMFSLSREAKGRGEHDSYIVTPLVRAGVVSQPHILKRIRRCAVCVAVNTFGAHFMLEIDMDSTNFAAQASRDWARLAREQWINVYWDEGKKQHVYQPALDQSMPVAHARADVQRIGELDLRREHLHLEPRSPDPASAVDRRLMHVGAMLAALGWRQAWVVDTEYKQDDGGLPLVHCVCAYDLISGQRREVWVEPGMPCPFDMSADVLFIFFEGDADALAFMSAGWPAPLNVLDPRIIWKKLDNGARETGPDGKKETYGLFEGADAFRPAPHPPPREGCLHRSRYPRSAVYAGRAAGLDPVLPVRRGPDRQVV